MSFGAPRRFRIWHPEGGLAFDEVLHHGDLVIFPRMWEHEVLKGKIPSTHIARAGGVDESESNWDAEGPPPAKATSMQEAGVRVNLTFRQV